MKRVSISPSIFLALVFNKRRVQSISYSELEECRRKIKSKTGCDVDWNHDSVLHTFGFYSPIFKEENAEVRCDLAELDKFYDTAVSDIPEKELDEMASALDAEPVSWKDELKKMLSQGHLSTHINKD